jgi:hypothetical protein
VPDVSKRQRSFVCAFKKAPRPFAASETIAVMTQRNIRQDDSLSCSVAGIVTALKKYVLGIIVVLGTGSQTVETGTATLCHVPGGAST